jgi:hypothetical protein
MADMEDDYSTPWWRTALRFLGVLLGLVALSGLLMGGIIAVARFFDTAGARTTAAPSYYETNQPPPAVSSYASGVKERSPYEPQDWPDTPGRRTGTGPAGRSTGVGRSTPPPEVPVGIPVEQYQEKVASGEKVYLPNPKGKCDLGGSAGSSRALDECFAARAAR